MAEPSADRDAALLLDMLLAAQDALSFLEGLDQEAFLASRLHQNAVMKSLEIISEAAGKVSAATRAANPDIAWRSITGLRHKLVHDYSQVQMDLVWVVVRNQLEPLIAALTPLIPDESDPAS